MPATPLIRVVEILPAGTWSGESPESICLDREDRFRRRAAMTTGNGLKFLLDEANAVALRNGDGLKLEDGRIVRVDAEPEAVADITATSPRELIRLAWHLGNRHLPTQLLDGKLRIRRDHVIEDMVVKLGGTVTLLEAPFDPEGGAYAEHSHDHGDHAPSHDHNHDHEHDHAAHDHTHSHGHPHD